MKTGSFLHLLFVSVFFIWTSIKSFSQENDTITFIKEEVIVTAQRYERNAFDLPQSVTSLSKKQIELSDITNAADALESIPGVWMQRTNLGGGSAFVRGFTGYQTLILVDDIRFNNSTFRSGPNQYLNTIDPFLMGRIEVVAGAGAVQYGSDAIGGVIHLITANPSFSESGLTIKGSVFGKLRSSDMEKTGRLEIGLAGKNIALTTGLSRSDYGNIKAGGNLGALSPTGYNTTGFDAKGIFRLGENSRLTAAYQFFRQNEVPLFHKIVTGDFSTYLFDPQDRQMTYLKYGQKLGGIVDSFDLTALYQDSNERRIKRRTGSATLTEEQDEVTTFGLLAKSRATLTKTKDLVWYSIAGVDYYFDDVSSGRIDIEDNTGQTTFLRGLYPDNSSSGQFSIYNSHTLEFKRIAFSGGLRFNRNVMEIPNDDLNDVIIKPSAWVWNFSTTYHSGRHHQVSFSANSAFRAPNINDVSSLGLADFRYEIPNYELEPERSLNLELGWKMDFSRLKTSAHVFNNSLTDLIINERSSFNGLDSISGAQVYQRVNVGKAVIRGAEFFGQYSFNPNLSVNGQVIYLYGYANENKNEPLRRIPPLNGRLGLNYRWNSWQLEGQWVFAQEQTRLSGGDIDDNRIAEGGTPGWEVFNIRVSYSNQWLLVNFGLENIFDKAYRMHGSGIDGLGRNIWVSTKISF